MLIFCLGSSSSSSNDSTTTVLSVLDQIESSLFVYLYPCLIEYSLISVTVFYLMWRNIGRTEKRSDMHFADRHLYKINCSRASRGLLIGGIIFLLTVLTIIPDYVLQPESAIPITHVTELVLLFIATLIVCVAFSSTTKLNYDRHGHANVFDQILILLTTVGDFAYSFFGLFAAVLIKSYTIKIPRAVEVAISLIAILQTFLQSAFILDTLKRRLTTTDERRNKPGREWITALLLINLSETKRSVAHSLRWFVFFSDLVARFSLGEESQVESVASGILQFRHLVHRASIYIAIVDLLSFSFQRLSGRYLARCLR